MKESKRPSPDDVPSLGRHGQMGHRLAHDLARFTINLRFLSLALRDK
jgi:hypothetical protein